jgi:hypothetical protein
LLSKHAAFEARALARLIPNTAALLDLSAAP